VSSDGYTNLPNSALPDGRLSWKAWGIYVYLLTRPPGWVIRPADLRNRSQDGEKSVYAGLRELVKVGLLETRYVSVEGKPAKRFVWPAERDAENRRDDSERDAENRHDENRHDENRHVLVTTEGIATTESVLTTEERTNDHALRGRARATTPQLRAAEDYMRLAAMDDYEIAEELATLESLSSQERYDAIGYHRDMAMASMRRWGADALTAEEYARLSPRGRELFDAAVAREAAPA
jgi:hypothetical protein